MTIDEIKTLLRKKAIIYHSEGGKSLGETDESWIGSVRWKQAGEGFPVDRTGETMIPLATFFLDGLPYRPKALSGIGLVTVFMSTAIWENLGEEDLSPWFVIRAYTSITELVPCEYSSSIIRAFPLRPELVENDFPEWDGGGIPEELESRIVAMEDAKGIEYYEDIHEGGYAFHKIGGYPSFCQSGFLFGGGYDFVMQIVSDDKAGLNIVDAGNFYFYYHSGKKGWKVYCDFY